jgi:transglutaminase-like putative cysteine protease
VSPTRVLALLGTLAMLGAYLQVLYYIVDVSGDPSLFLPIVAGALLAGTLLARVLRVRTAFVLALSLLVGGLAWYLVSLPHEPELVPILESNLELLSGQSLLQIERAAVWALSVTPGPAFMMWYLGLRRWYTGAVAVGTLSLSYLVLTGDAATTVTLVGVIGGAAALGFGDLDRRSGSGAAAEYVAMVLALMVLVPALVTVVPGGAGAPLSLTGGGGGDGSLEADLVDLDGQLDVRGAIELTPTARFSVQADEPRLWRVGSYDRFTGDGWIQTGQPQPYDADETRVPPGETGRVTQRYVAESATGVMPAAWRPVSVEGDGVADLQVSTAGGFRPETTLAPGDSYRVTSAVLRAQPDVLDDAGRDYPDAIADRYLQLPESTPDRVAQRTDRLTANAQTPYQTARVVENWLQTNRAYSLDVEKPEGNVADAFLFEMESGYCVYYATTMTAMLRTQDIPARMVVGYTTGQQVESGEYLVRGYNSHAWVEVYFPDQGWVAFDPTPAGPRVAAEQARLSEARATGVPNVDTNESEPETPTPSTNVTTPSPSETETPGFGRNTSGPNSTTTTGPAAGGGGFSLPALPSREELALGAVVLVGAAAGLRRTGVATRAVRGVWLRYQRRRDPATDVEGAYRRLSYLLERRHRPRRPGETPRQYLDALDVDERYHRVYRARERLRYGHGVTAADADEVVDLVQQLVSEGE